MGRRADDVGRKGLEASRPRCKPELLGRAGVALRLPMAATRARTDRNSVRGARQTLEADPRRVRRRGRGCLLRAPSRRGPFRRNDVRALPRCGQGPQTLRDQLRSVALRTAAAQLSRIYRYLPRPHQGVSRQGRRVQPDRPAGRLFGLRVMDRTRRPLPLARRRPGRFRRRVLEDGAIRLLVLGGARMGMRAQAPRGRGARGRRLH